MGIEGKGSNHNVERVKGGEKSESGSEEKEAHFGLPLIATRFENEPNIKNVGEGVGDKEGDCVVHHRALEADLVAQSGVKRRIESVTKDIDEGPVNREGCAAAEEVFRELLRPWGNKSKEFLKKGGHRPSS